MPDLGEFPPDEHLARELRIAYRIPEAGHIRLTIPVVPEILRADGTVQSEVLATILDETTGFVSVLAALPDWGSTAALEMQFPLVPIEARGDLVVDGRILKAGRRLIFVEAEVGWQPQDGSGARRAAPEGFVAHAAGQFARVGRAAHNVAMDIPTPDPDVELSMASETAALHEPYPQRLGVHAVGPATVEMAFGDYVRNSSGILHGGVVAALAIAAAEHAAGAPATSASVQYLSAGRVGPFRATAERRFDRGAATCWVVDTLDVGDHGGASGSSGSSESGESSGEGARRMTRATVTTGGHR